MMGLEACWRMAERIRAACLFHGSTLLNAVAALPGPLRDGGALQHDAGCARSNTPGPSIAAPTGCLSESPRTRPHPARQHRAARHSAGCRGRPAERSQRRSPQWGPCLRDLLEAQHTRVRAPQERQTAEQPEARTRWRRAREPSRVPGRAYRWCTCPARSTALCGSSRAQAYVGSHSCGRSAAAPPRSRSAPGRALFPARRPSPLFSFSRSRGKCSDYLRNPWYLPSVAAGQR